MTTGTTPRTSEGNERREHAAMEPRRDDGDDTTYGTGDYAWLLPQWSPVVTTGTTFDVGPGSTARRRAAMEPRRDDGDDVGRGDRCG